MGRKVCLKVALTVVFAMMTIATMRMIDKDNVIGRACGWSRSFGTMN